MFKAFQEINDIFLRLSWRRKKILLIKRKCKEIERDLEKLWRELEDEANTR